MKSCGKLVGKKYALKGLFRFSKLAYERRIGMLTEKKTPPLFVEMIFGQKYLPDTLSEQVHKIFGIDRVMFWSFFSGSTPCAEMMWVLKSVLQQKINIFADKHRNSFWPKVPFRCTVRAGAQNFWER